MIGPFTITRKYHKWLFAALALRSALSNLGSTADLVLLCAVREENNHQPAFLLPDEEELLRQHGIYWRYVTSDSFLLAAKTHFGG